MDSSIITPMLVFSDTLVYTNGFMLVFYYGKPIALVDNEGNILMRDESFPIFLVDYLIQNPAPDYRWN